MNNAAINIPIQVLHRHLFSLVLGIYMYEWNCWVMGRLHVYPSVELSEVAIPFCIPNSSVWEFWGFLYPDQHLLSDFLILVMLMDMK